MSHITLSNQDGIAVATMERGKANALGQDLIAELLEMLAKVEGREDTHALVLASGRSRFFSAGFDVGEVFAYERDAMGEFFGRFIDLYERALRFHKPLVAAVNGHALAGGAVLALAADQRVMAAGGYAFALNEVNLGVALPPGVMRMAIAAVGYRAARDLLLTGRSVGPAEALSMGLVDDVVPEAQVLEVAVARAREMARKPPRTFAAVKRTLIELAGFSAGVSDREGLEPFLDHWFSAECAAARGALLRSLKK